MLNFYINENIKINNLLTFIKIFLLIIITNNFLRKDIKNKNIMSNNFGNYEDFLKISFIENITKINNIFFTISDLKYSYSQYYGLIEIGYNITLYNSNNNIIKPSEFALIYDLHILCEIYIYEKNEYIYSIANINENKNFFCIEYINLHEDINFGIIFYKINESNEEIEFNEQFFFTDQIISKNLNPVNENNNKFNIYYLYNNYYKLLHKINKSKNRELAHKETLNLKSSFLKPPLCFLKRDIALIEGRWYFNNLYENYFCFCKGQFCINLQTFKNNYQFCKYYFYLTLLEKHKYFYQKTDYLFSDFFDENIESADAFPIFEAMIKENLNAHYLTMSKKIYNDYYSRYNNYNSEILYGQKNINGDFVETYFDLLLKLKAVITAEQINSIDNIFYNIDYITYIFLGHGVTYIKSYLYNDYISYKKYNKILLPPSEKFINLALDVGWKIEDIIKIGYPRWDKYKIYMKNNLRYQNTKEKSIFLMFTWRQAKRGQNISQYYNNNIYNILYDIEINDLLRKNNIKIFFCLHHKLKYKMKINNNDNIRLINQNDISKLLINSSLIITDFSSIMFDAMVQKKPLILYIPDGLDPNLKDIYIYDHYETITKLKNGLINLFEIFFELKEVKEKIKYYIKNNFTLEDEKLRFYKGFRLENKDNTHKLIRYIKRL